MKESSTLEATRRWSLWAAIISFAVVLVLVVLWTWGAFNLTDRGSYIDDMLFGAGLSYEIPFTAWAKIIMTFSAIASTATSILLTLLVAKFAKKGK